MSRRSRAIAFDVDAASFATLQEALPGWQIDVVAGDAVATLPSAWDPGIVDLLIVGARDEVTQTLGLCRLLASCAAYPRGSRPAAQRFSGLPDHLQDQQRGDAPLLVLVPPGQEALIGEALDAGARSCLTLPIKASAVVGVLARAQTGNRPGRHTSNLDRAQVADAWQDEGGQG